ncbi:MAG: hypothetical protein FWG91_07090 [Lachnospiraceae bacterium]|nr:hypothetical protein [Lachnospiraceae bacterium]
MIAPKAIGEFGFEISFDILLEKIEQAGINGDSFTLFYVSDDGRISDYGKLKSNDNGSVTVTINHASYYILMGEIVEEILLNEYNNTKKANPISVIGLVFVMLVISAGVAVLINKKRDWFKRI